MGIRESIRSAISFIRPLNLLIIAASVVMGFVIGGLLLSRLTVLTATQFVLIAASGYAVNDLKDIEADRINRPRRALPSGALTLRVGRAIAFLLCLSAIVNMFFLPLKAASVAAAVLAAACIYGLSAKKAGISGNLAVAGMTAAPLYTVLLFSPDAHNLTALTFFAFLITLLREIMKDLNDLPGDLVCGKRTLPALAGTGVTRLALCILTFIFLAATIRLRYSAADGIVYLFIVAGVCNGMNVAALLLGFKEKYSAACVVYKINMLIGIGGVWLSS